jgi:hypothetical protein
MNNQKKNRCQKGHIVGLFLDVNKMRLKWWCEKCRKEYALSPSEREIEKWVQELYE